MVRTAEHNAKIAKSMKAYHKTCEGVKKADRVVKVKAPKVPKTPKVKAPKVAKGDKLIKVSDIKPKNSGEAAIKDLLENLTPAQQKDALKVEPKAKKPRSAAQLAHDKKLSEPGMKAKAEKGREKAAAKRKREAKKTAKQVELIKEEVKQGELIQKQMDEEGTDDEGIEVSPKFYNGKEYFVDEKTGGIWDMEQGQLIGIWDEKTNKPNLI